MLWCQAVAPGMLKCPNAAVVHEGDLQWSTRGLTAVHPVPAVRRGDIRGERHSPQSAGGRLPGQAHQQQQSVRSGAVQCTVGDEMNRSQTSARMTLKRETQALTLFCGYGMVLLT